ncbi:aminotransferase class V-fold PLP-dependent enzyme [Methanorbis rubei]|uniref:cysteine desulfurase n=1 Tax=Methanorbis rubei TaxID=3028300 RepID=A0AAE4SD38_9EURY|nr:Cysteine desulfurase [Methanocorpusculaceae archaeon Cs1]
MPHEYKKYPHQRKNQSAKKPHQRPPKEKPQRKEVKPGYYVAADSDDYLTKHLYWCPRCNVPLVAKTCSCDAETIKIPLQQPYDIRPVLKADYDLLQKLITDRFGPRVTLPKVMVFNKAGGLDRNELVIANGVRFAWLWFDPVSRRFRLDIEAEALPYLIGKAEKNIINLETAAAALPTGRLGGKKVAAASDATDGVVILKYKSKYGTGILKDGFVRIKELVQVEQKSGMPNPSWDEVVERNAFHLKNMERTAVREIKQNLGLAPVANCSFSGGKDSTAVWQIAQKAGVTDVFFIDTGLEFPETVEFVKSQNVRMIQKAGDFWQAVEKAGPPGKDHRWCCKLLKLNPLKVHLAETGPCVTVQGNRWYESWSRASLDAVSQNPNNPMQINLSPIRSWRALDVFLYLWLREVPYNSLYERGYERIGCYLCPAMLESELATMHETHPAMAERWDEFLNRWAADRGLPPEFVNWGLWRWKDLPPKMKELVREANLDLSEKPVKRSTPSSVAHLMPEGKAVDVVDVEPAVPEAEALPLTDWEAVRSKFPILGDLMYLDNAATSFAPEPVLLAMDQFERTYRANVGRGVHRLTRIASQKYWHAHEIVADFINGAAGTTVFVKNTTEAVTMIARGLDWKAGDCVVTTILEHHSNLLPWRALEKYGVTIRVVGLKSDLTLDMDALLESMDDSVRLVAVTHASNVTGTVTPVAEIVKLCKKHGALLAVDAAQSVPHMPVDVAALGADFVSFSGHKMCGPTGTGVLWMKNPILEPLFVGGGMVEQVGENSFTFAEGFHRYEAGTPNIAGGIGLGAAAVFLKDIGMKNIEARERELTNRLIEKLSAVPGVKLYVPADPTQRIGVVSFKIPGISPHEAAAYLDDEAGIMVRSGMHCAEPLMRYLECPEGTIRASIAFYNTESEIDTLAATILEIAG